MLNSWQPCFNKANSEYRFVFLYTETRKLAAEHFFHTYELRRCLVHKMLAKIVKIAVITVYFIALVVGSTVRVSSPEVKLGISQSAEFISGCIDRLQNSGIRSTYIRQCYRIIYVCVNHDTQTKADIPYPHRFRHLLCLYKLDGNSNVQQALTSKWQVRLRIIRSHSYHCSVIHILHIRIDPCQCFVFT